MMRSALTVLAWALLSGCSAKAVYDNVQHDRQLRCERVPPAQYEACMEGYTMPYEEYERQRELQRDTEAGVDR